MNERQVKRAYIVLIVLVLVTIASGIIHFMYVSAVNQRIHTVDCATEQDPIYADIHFRGDTTSSWEKEESGLTGRIYDVVLNNNSQQTITDWTLTIHIADFCYINQFWSGEVEIHQYADAGIEKVQTLNLANYDPDGIELDYIMEDSDLLIPLYPEDYVVYHPSEQFKETTLVPKENKVVGGIFYFWDETDFTNYTLRYHIYQKYSSGLGFYLIIGLTGITILYAAMIIVARYVYRKSQYENQLRLSGISCLSALYSLVYVVDIVEQTITPVGVESVNDKERPRHLSAQAQFDNLFSFDPKEVYRELTLEFVNLDTLQDRLESRNSITMEYESERFGWSRLQFIVMERSETGRLKKVLFTTQQIKEEKMEMERILSQVEQAQLESSSKSAFLANMSHEIRTPINTILGLDTMILRESTNETVRHYARDIKVAGNMLLAMINSILDFSKMEAGKMEIIEGEYSIKKLVYEVETVVRSRIEKKNLAFRIEVSENLPSKLLGDDVRMKQVIVNLLTNALKYTDQGGIRLGVFGKELGDGREHILISVKDTGFGITPENQKKLFDRFTRFDEKKNRTVEGTGIGMNLVQGLLKMMNSQLKVASVYGSGSDFYFELEQKIIDPTPIGKVDWDHVEDLDDEDYQVSFIAPKANLLVVDDNEMNLMVFENLLKETKIHIDKAISGIKALEMVKDKKYDIIFLDHMMPEMDGIETFRRLKEDSSGKNFETPIIILTANALHGAKEEYLKEGFTDFLAKPIDEDHLEEIVLQYLPENLVEEGKRKVAKKPEMDNEGALPEIEGVDISYALNHNGSVDGALRVMQQFAQVGKMDEQELRDYMLKLQENEKDADALNSYRIKVHSMKTSAALCGALQIYGSAAQLEMAARKDRVKQIVETTEYFLEGWSALTEQFKNFFRMNETIDKKEGDIRPEALISLLDQLVTSMNAYDVKSADAIIEELGTYTDDAKLQESLETLRGVVANLDAPKCEEICKQIKGE